MHRMPAAFAACMPITLSSITTHLHNREEFDEVVAAVVSFTLPNCVTQHVLNKEDSLRCGTELLSVSAAACYLVTQHHEESSC